jgi:Alternative complex III, ActD subunit
MGRNIRMPIQTAGNPQSPLFGVAAEFDSARDLFHAAEQMRDAGFTRFDVFSPFPIHGMDAAMGLKRSVLGKIIFLGGLIGFVTAVTVQFVPSSFIYPLIVMGKPTNLFTVPAFFPIMFEFTVLISAFTATFGMLIMNGLPRLNHPMFNWERFKRVSDDKFFCVIETKDPKFAEREVRDFLESLGGRNITKVHED